MQFFKFTKAWALLGSLVVTQISHAALTSYGAGNISDHVNSASAWCTEDHGFWIHNTGIVEPGISGCNNGVPVGSPTLIYPNLVGNASNEPTMTHRWWGSISFYGEMPVGDTSKAGYITPDPMTARVTERGVRIMGMPSGLKTNDGYRYEYSIPDPFSEVFDGIAIGNSSYANLDAYVKDFSDGAIVVQWQSGSTIVMKAVIVHGSPYAYFEALQGDLVVRTKSPNGGEKGIFYQSGDHLGVWTDVAGIRNNFLITGHTSTAFSNTSSNQIGVSNSVKRLTVTWLPQTTGTPSTAMIDFFKQYATTRINEVSIDYNVNRSTNKVTVTHTYKWLGTPVTTVAGMLPLAWKNSNQATSSYKIRSSRGITKFAATSSFSYEIPFIGLLPTFPAGIGDYNLSTLQGYVNEWMAKPVADWTKDAGGNEVLDTYWIGKVYGKVSELAAIARGIGMTSEANTMINFLKNELEDWFHADTTGSLDTVKYFAYDSNWNTLLGMNESFGAHQQLNDHHFHYGYFVRAAAEICRVDVSWCSSSQYGPMVELLIRDYAGGRGDSMFPYLRNFDPAYGFSWASGHANFVLGNNNESTSEAANAYGSIVMYGMITGNDDLVERGMYLHASSAATYWEYWNDIDGWLGVGGDYKNFASDYGKITTSIIWGNGHVFSTWFSGAYAHILGIQGLPLSPLVLHIGQHADYLVDYFNLGMSGESTNGKPSGLPAGHWRDVWWNMWAMTNGDAAVADFNSMGGNYDEEFGETKAHVYHWIHTFKELGHLDTNITANHPAAVVFDKNGSKTYIAYNFDHASSKSVTFSDGTTANIAPNSFFVRKPGGFIIDNGDPEFEQGGSWATSSATGGYYGADYSHDNGSGIDTGDWTRWKPTFPATQTYQVYARWTSHSNRADNIKYKVYHQGSVTEVWRNQQTNGGSWQSLGTYVFSAGSSDNNAVTLDAGSDSGYVIADAVCFVTPGETCSE